MYTLSHPLAPTVSYECELGQSIASYATDHLHEFDVFVAEVEPSSYGLGIEVFDKSTGKPLGIATIH